MRLNVSGAAAGYNDIPNPFKPATLSTQKITPMLRGFRTYQIGDIGAVPRVGDNPIRFYAVNGDINNVLLGERTSATLVNSDYRNILYNWYEAPTQPVRVLAGRDIVNFGTGTAYGAFTPSLIVNRDPTDVSMLHAGRDIWYANVEMGGPGLLEVVAGRTIYQGNHARITSIGPMLQGDTRSGAGIAILAGAGAAGPDWKALAALYLDPARQADLRPGYPLANQPGKVAQTYQEDLIAWLSDRYDYEAPRIADALAYFNALAPEQQRIFLRQVYFAEIKAGGREYNDPASTRFGSYLRARQAIAALFPTYDIPGRVDEQGAWVTAQLAEQIVSGVAAQSHAGIDPAKLLDAQGLPYAQRYAVIERGGDFILFQGDKSAGQNNGSVRTVGGGSIQVMAPAGQIVIGVEGVQANDNPAMSPAGLLTQFQGDIQLFSQGSLLLGLSRIMTTFGGDVQGWSVMGDINAGRGAKTSRVFTPPQRIYDTVGNVRISPQAPSTGAGIATLAPIPEVPAGDVDLIAPLGTIDAGEAGIRSSGNVNVAALQVMNAANIKAQGESTGIPVVAAVNTGALTSASAASTSAATAAQESVSRARNEARQNQPSIFSVQILGFGGESASSGGGESASLMPASGASAQSAQASYDPTSMVKIIGLGERMDARHLDSLTDAQR